MAVLLVGAALPHVVAPVTAERVAADVVARQGSGDTLARDQVRAVCHGRGVPGPKADRGSVDRAIEAVRTQAGDCTPTPGAPRAAGPPRQAAGRGGPPAGPGCTGPVRT